MSNRFDTGSILADILEREQPYKASRQFQNLDFNKIPDNDKIKRIQGSLVGLAVGDALGASVEFRPNVYLKEHPVKDMQSGGTWGLELGQWTDDTSMALCLAASLIVKKGFNAYDQFVRYRRWYRDGYMSSTGKCFDIGKSTREAITDFENRLQKIRGELKAKNKNQDDIDRLSEIEMCKAENGLRLGTPDSAGNGPLMRLAPIPCFFFESYDNVKENIDEATQLTHGDQRAIDACRFYAGLIWHAINGESKEKLLEPMFYQNTLKLNLHQDVRKVAEGSYKRKDGYKGGIRGKGYVVDSLEAALWAFYNDGKNFNEGVLLAVNLGDDTDTTAAIYGELAGAVYGIDEINLEWIKKLYEGEFIKAIAKCLYVTGKNLKKDLQRSEWEEKDSPNTNSEGHKPSGTNEARRNSKSDATHASSSSQQTGTDNKQKPTDQKKTDGKAHTNNENNTEQTQKRPNILS